MIDTTTIHTTCGVWLFGILLLLIILVEIEGPANKREVVKRIILVIGWPVALVTYVPYLALKAFFNYWKNLPD